MDKKLDKKRVFSSHLKTLREELGYTPKRFADKLNIKQQTYYAYENGRAFPSMDVLINIAETCNVSLDWLCGVTQNRESITHKTDIAAILSKLLKANEQGQQIEVRISCPGIGSIY